MPRSIPNSAFLQNADVNDDGGGVERQGDILPELCDSYDRQDRIGVRRTRHYEFRAKGTPREYLYDGSLEQTITVYRGDGAEDFLDAARSAVADCPRQNDSEYRLGTAPKAGDEAIIIEHSHEQPASDDAEPGDVITVTDRTAIVRDGDTVTILNAQGWEGGGVKAATMTALAKSAATRIAAWR